MEARPAAPDRVGGCCDIPAGRAYTFAFRDRGRAFLAYLYASGESALEGSAMLNSLRVL